MIDAWAVLGAAVFLINETISTFFTWAFCVRAAPRELRVLRGVAWMYLGATAIGIRVGDWSRWTTSWGWVALAIVTIPVMVYNVTASLGADGDRCVRGRVGTSKRERLWGERR